MKTFNRQTGNIGENVARKALLQKGYKIIETNFRNKFGEIDIIAQDKQTLVFIEVKTKTGQEFGSPEEMINKSKLNKIRHMAMVFTKGHELNCRLDIIAIVLNPAGQITRLTHYENVY